MSNNNDSATPTRGPLTFIKTETTCPECSGIVISNTVRERIGTMDMLVDWDERCTACGYANCATPQM